MDDPVSLMNKPVNDLTVKDALKINLAIVAAMVAIPVVIAGASAAKEKVSSLRRERKAKKALKALDEK